MASPEHREVVRQEFVELVVVETQLAGLGFERMALRLVARHLTTVESAERPVPVRQAEAVQIDRRLGRKPSQVGPELVTVSRIERPVTAGVEVKGCVEDATGLEYSPDLLEYHFDVREMVEDRVRVYQIKGVVRKVESRRIHLANVQFPDRTETPLVPPTKLCVNSKRFAT